MVSFIRFQLSVNHFGRMLQTGWRSWPVGSYEVHALHSSSAHTIIVFTFFNAAFLTALFYMSVMAYNEGHYYLYHRVQQGKLNSLLTIEY